jgi:hypothetical protein
MAYTCMTAREYRMMWHRKKRAEYFEGKTCADCEATEGLMLWNLDPDKGKDDLRNIWSCKEAVRQEILAHCIVVCRQHSGRRQSKRRLANADHGDLRYARAHTCYCTWCGPLMRGYTREWRQIRWQAMRMGIALPLISPDPDDLPEMLPEVLRLELNALTRQLTLPLFG